MTITFDKEGKITLHYFNAKGRAEVIRYILHYAKVAFEDHRVARPDWPNMKPIMPLNQLPVLEMTSKDGETKTSICQSATMVRALAHMYGLDGKTWERSVIADEAFESLKEINEALMKAWTKRSIEERDQMFRFINSELLPRILGLLEKMYKDNKGKGIAGGDEYTYADLDLAQLMYDLFRLIPGTKMEDIKANYPGLSAIAKDINESPEIKTYLDSRPHTEY